METGSGTPSTTNYTYRGPAATKDLNTTALSRLISIDGIFRDPVIEIINFKGMRNCRSYSTKRLEATY